MRRLPVRVAVRPSAARVHAPATAVVPPARSPPPPPLPPPPPPLLLSPSFSSRPRRCSSFFLNRIKLSFYRKLITVAPPPSLLALPVACGPGPLGGLPPSGYVSCVGLIPCLVLSDTICVGPDQLIMPRVSPSTIRIFVTCQPDRPINHAVSEPDHRCRASGRLASRPHLPPLLRRSSQQGHVPQTVAIANANPGPNQIRARLPQPPPAPLPVCTVLFHWVKVGSRKSDSNPHKSDGPYRSTPIGRFVLSTPKNTNTLPLPPWPRVISPQCQSHIHTEPGVRIRLYTYMEYQLVISRS